MTGPSTIYYSEGGGTWTASGRGGYEPYTFDWFIEDSVGNSEYVGSGASWSGYPGEGVRRVRAKPTDSRGARHDSSMEVVGIGNDQCQPEPPALECQAGEQTWRLFRHRRKQNSTAGKPTCASCPAGAAPLQPRRICAGKHRCPLCELRTNYSRRSAIIYYSPEAAKSSVRNRGHVRSAPSRARPQDSRRCRSRRS